MPEGEVKLVDPQGNPISTLGVERGQLWQERIKQANDYYDTWSTKYQTKDLEEYYYGHQWEIDEDSLTKDDRYNPYTTNRIFVAIDVKMPSLLFQNPIFSIAPKPSKQEWDEESSSERAQLREDVLNYFSTSGFLGLAEETELAILDAFFRFGVVEVGYSADWIENPNRGKPLLDVDQQEVVDSKGEVIKEPPRIPQHEKIYLKRIPSNRFRVSAMDHQQLDRCSWFGYWEYVRTEDIMANKSFDAGEFNLVSARSPDFNSPEALQDELEQQVETGNLTKLWKIYDTRDRKILYLANGVTKILKERKFKRIPIFPLKFRERLLGFYPLPLAFNWKAPQEELNEIRESARLHRRRFQRKYIAASGAFNDEEELDKLQYGPDGTIVKSSIPNPANAIVAMPNADLGAQHFENSENSIRDFDTISGTPVTSRQVRSGSTATEASIEDKRATVRESRDRLKVANWLCAIGKEILLQAKERLTQPFWIKLSATEDDNFSQIDEIEELWRLINSEELGNEDFDVDISVSSLSPITQDQEKRKYIEFISLLSQFPIISMSPALVIETANKVGYRNSKVLGVFQKFAQAQQLAALMQAEQTIQQAGGQGEGNQISQRTVAQETPQDIEQVRNELGNLSTQVQ